MCGVSSRSSVLVLARSGRGSSGRSTTTYGRRWPASPSAIDGLRARRSRRGTCGCGRRPARTSARCAARAPTAIASSGSSMTSDGDAGPLELADGAPRRQRDDRDVVARRGRSGSRASRGAPGRRRWCRSPGPRRRGSARPPGSGRASDGRRGRDRRAAARVIVSRPFVGRAGAGLARRPRPTRTCRARRRAGSRAGASRSRARARRRRWTMTHAGRQVAGVRVDAGVVVEVAVRRLEVDAGGDPPAADGQERQAQRRRPAPNSSNRRRKKTRLWSPPGVSAGTGRPRPSASGGGR